MSVRGLFGAVAIATVAVCGAAHATTFGFSFDNNGLSEPDGFVAPPIVGTGVFYTPDVLTPGLYALSDLSSYSMSYSFSGGQGFTAADILTPLDGVALDVTTFGSGLRMVWTEVPSSPDADGGPLNGALDLGNVSGDTLSFEPSFFGGNQAYEVDNATVFGNYLAVTVVPEPATWALMIGGVGLAGAMLRRRQRATAAA